MNWSNPYESSRGVWLKGNLHTHTRDGSGCGQMSLADALRRYAGLGYDFLCISDHMTLTAPPRALAGRLLLIPGLEWNSSIGEHMTVCSFRRPVLQRCVKSDDQAALLHFLAKQPALVVLNHPNWQEPCHYSREVLMARKSAHGIEIYNGVIERLPGSALATDKWDQLLSSGRRVLGFASDDAHRLEDIGQGWIVVRAAARTPQAVVEAIRQGNFYSSTGVTIRSVRRQGARLAVETADADEIWAVGGWGVRLARVRGRRMEFDCRECRSPYVRFVAFGRGPATAWTQPFFLDVVPEAGRTSPFVSHWSISRLESRRLSDAPAVGLDDPKDWAPVQAMASPKGFVCVSCRYPRQDGVVYLANRFAVRKSGDWVISLGHDGGAKMFVDGERVLYQPTRVNPCVPDRSQATVHLTRGRHEIVVVLDTDHGLGEGIFLRFILPAGTARPSGRVAFPVRLAR